ncbi:DUF4811 domain-containing protein [Limosilactobacillus fermentum]|uniref:DUF4811 domain-containing protein n=1 Tax=Limosilactobacillus fermentum TaxID=1613 RepID=UPI003313C90F
MIIVLVLLSTIAFYLFTAVWQKMPGRMLWSLVSLVVLVLSIVSFVLHDNRHMGMKLETTNTTSSLVSPNKNLNVLVYKQLGSGSEKVYVYKTDPNAKKTTTTRLAANTKSTVKTTTSTNATVVKHTKRWVYKNGFSKLMFGILGDDNEVDQVTYTFNINDQWLVLSSTQAAKLQALMKDVTAQAAMKSKVAALVQEEVAAKLKANPTMSATNQAALQAAALKSAEATVIGQMLK